MNSPGVLIIYLIFYLNQLGSVICDGDHAHVHGEADTATHTTSTGPTGSVTTVHTTSGDAGGGQSDAFSGILASLSPEVINNLQRNPQVAQYLKAYGIDASKLNAAKAAADAGGTVSPPTSGGYDYPPPPAGGGFGGGLPFSPFFGPYKNLRVSGDVGDYGGYFLIVKKVHTLFKIHSLKPGLTFCIGFKRFIWIVINYFLCFQAIIVIGGGILILVILALLTKGISKGGLFYGLGTSLSEALAGSASVDVGPFHKSVAGAAAVNVGAGGRPVIANHPDNMQVNYNVQNALDQRF